MVFAFVVPFLLGSVACQTITPQCAALSPKPTAPHTVQYTAFLPEQIAPTSTIYGAILTKHLNVSRDSMVPGNQLTLTGRGL